MQRKGKGGSRSCVDNALRYARCRLVAATAFCLVAVSANSIADSAISFVAGPAKLAIGAGEAASPKVDILWRNFATGEGCLRTVADQEWRIIGFVDFSEGD